MHSAPTADQPAAPATQRPSMRERIAQLRQTFVDQLPARIDRMRYLSAQLMASAAGERSASTLDGGAQQYAELHRLAHNLKGSGASFGFDDLAASASAIETLLHQQPYTPEGLRPLAQQLNELSALAQVVRAHAPCAAPPVSGWTPPARPTTAQQSSAQGRATDGSHDSPPPSPVLYLCDDDPHITGQLSAQLACFGYECICFTEPAALQEAVHARRPDVVIMDIHFPQGHSAGIEVLQALQAQTGVPLPAVFLSSREDFQARLGAVRAGGQAYFVKPVRANDLVSTLDTLTRGEQPEPYRILIVDDEPQTAQYHALLLQEAGMHTHELHEPGKILQALEQFHPDLVLMDMYMPGSSGREAAAIIRQVPSHMGLPIVYLTSETDRIKLLSAMRIGVEGFLSKPVVAQELVAAVLIRAERMRALRTLMARDSLTGLYNHTMTTQLLESALAQAQREDGTLSLVMLDMDHFKNVNDTWGHLAGDQVLLALSRLLQQRLRASDTIGRYGGEEFAIVLRGQTLAQAAERMQALREDFSKIIFHSQGKDFQCTFSAGIAAYPQYQRYEQLREAADRALYQAKRQGRNRIATDVFETPDAP